MYKLEKKADDKFIYFVFDKSEFYEKMKDEKYNLSDLEIKDFGKSNLLDVGFISDDNFVVGIGEKNKKYLLDELYSLDDERYDYYSGIFIGYSKKLDITISMEHMEEFHIFKGDQLNLRELYNKQK